MSEEGRAAGDIFYAFAVVKAIMTHDRYPTLPARTQAALTSSVVLHCNREGWFEFKYETLGRELGVAPDNAGRALRVAVPTFIEIIHQRRSDGKQRGNAFRLSADLRARADDFVCRFTSGKSKTSPGPGSDDFDGRPGSDENVGAGTVFEGSLNGLPTDDFDTPPAEEVAAIRALLSEHDLLRSIGDAA